MKTHTSIAISALAGMLQFSLVAAPKELPLRRSTGIAIYESTTTRAVATEYGVEPAALAFSTTTTYDFYSSPLASPCDLTSHDKGGGRIYVQNLSDSHANDFSVTARMQFYDYDPATGAQALIVDTGASNQKNVDAGKTVNLSLPKVALTADKSIPSGHLLRVAVTIDVITGNPAGFGQLLYDGKRANSSAAFLSEDTNLSLNFVPSVPPTQPNSSLEMLFNGSAKITCSGSPNQSYGIQATTSLASPSWTTIGTNTTGADGLCEFIDNDASHFPARFYRIVVQ